MRSLRRRLLWTVLAGAAAILLAIVFSCAVGTQPISFRGALAGVEPDHAILFQLRLPRALLAAVVGAALAGAGVALQALLRNALAEPYLLGVSGGAALGGTIVILAGALVTQGFGVQLALLAGEASVAAGAVVGAVGAALLVFALGRVQGSPAPETTLLVGVVFNAFSLAMITILRVLVTPEQAARLTYWMLGSLAYQRSGTILAGAVGVLATLGLLVAFSGRLNFLTLADEEAASLGVDVRRTRGWVFVASSAATGAAVALAGMIGFVGLIVPHLIRRLVGPDHRLLVPCASLFGAAFLVLADALARLLFLPLGTEPPVGAVTAFLGGPFFLWLLRRSLRGAR